MTDARPQQWLDQRNPPPGWDWVDQEIGSTYVRAPGGRATPLMQAWNIWLTDALDAAKCRIDALEQELSETLDEMVHATWERDTLT